MKFDLKLLEFTECDVAPSKLAISGSNRDLSWFEFKSEVEALKDEILNYKLPLGHPIIIYGHKEVEFIVSIVACLSLRLPYLPVDNIFPQARVDKIQEITGSALVINTKSKKINFLEKNKNTEYFKENDPVIYIMFTSGSTGEPKGVVITHESVVDYISWIQKDFPFSDNDVFVNQIPFSFDLSTYELFGFLMHGASIISFSRDLISDSKNFIDKISRYQCTIWNSTPSFLLLSLMSVDFREETLPLLKKFFLAGEQMPHKTAKKLFNSFKNVSLYNTYGPTEVTNTSTFVEITQNILEKYKLIPVGYPKSTTEIRLLNKEFENGKEVGEIQLIGNNVSVGYFNNQQLNKDKFSIVNGIRAFRTGDYGYYENDMLFFLGRRDDLVKLHGFRVETTEIDNEISKIDGIIDSITIPLKRGKDVVRLISFFIANNEIKTDEIKKYIAESLPYYMIPSDIIQIEKFPYNTNNKIDRNRLIDIYKNK